MTTVDRLSIDWPSRMTGLLLPSHTGHNTMTLQTLNAVLPYLESAARKNKDCGDQSAVAALLILRSELIRAYEDAERSRTECRLSARVGAFSQFVYDLAADESDDVLLLDDSDLEAERWDWRNGR
jgi:hypothetical protein